MIVIAKTRADQVYDYLLDQISKMQPGANKLPAEDELSERLGVSRATVREALKQLLRNGFIKTVHGKGTFGFPSVVHMRTRTNLGANFLSILKDNFESASISIDWIGMEEHGALLQRLYPERNDRVHLSKWNYYADGVQVIYGESEIFASSLSTLPEPDDSITDVAAFGAKYLKEPLAYVAYDVRCEINATVSQRFSVPAEQPVIYWVERYYDLMDRICGAGIYYFHPDKISLMTTIAIEKINNLY